LSYRWVVTVLVVLAASFAGFAATRALGQEGRSEAMVLPWIVLGAGIALAAFLGALQFDADRRSRSREELSRLFTLSRDLMCIAGFDGYYRRINPAFARTFGHSEEELLTRPWADFVHDEDRERVLAEASWVMTGEEPRLLENRIRCKDGSQRWLEWIGLAVPEQELIYAIGRDITERKHAEQELQAAENRYRKLIEALPLVTYVDRLDETSSNLYSSPQTEALLGYAVEDWANDPELFLKLIHPDDRERVLAEHAHVRRTWEPLRTEYRFVGRDGRTVWVRDEAQVMRDREGDEPYLNGFLLDITAEKEAEERQHRLEAELAQAQRMETVGRLAGGIAHDFNNLLTAISGYSDLALTGLDERNAAARADIEEVSRAATRAEGLVRQLLAFSRRQVLRPRVIDANGLVDNMKSLLRPLIGEHIEIRTDLDPALGQIRADPGQLEQVILNLAVNARDAMPDGGVLAIASRNLALGLEEAEAKGLPAGEYIALSVSDTGHGIDEATRGQIFEPFFTTKGPGKGTGLGLSTVHGVVRQSGGSIDVTSEPDGGATFTIIFPRVEALAEEAERQVPDDVPAGSAETILVVEDEEQVRSLTSRMLESQGYRVMAAASAEEAFALASESEEHIDLLVTDLVMPGISGYELARRLLAAKNQLKVLYVSGYSDDAGLRKGELPHHRPLLEKPFSAADLAQAVRSVLES
jgi:two-component system, cell cycle sensor histidine kinase and response regulator CckA